MTDYWTVLKVFQDNVLENHHDNWTGYRGIGNIEKWALTEITRSSAG